MPRVLAVAVLATAFASLVPAGSGEGGVATAGSARRTATYIVEFAAKPVARYRGGLRSFAATSPTMTGRDIRPQARAVRRYRAYLDDLQRSVVARAGGHPRVVASYRYTYAGFAAELTRAQAEKLELVKGVGRVTPDGTVRTAASDPLANPSAALAGEGAHFLGLPEGVWKRLGGANSAGAGVIVGVIDTGINPSHPSFADQPIRDGRRLYYGSPYERPAGWRGICQTGPGFPKGSCNNKLIAARYFVDGFNRKNVSNRDFLSPRDVDGHGSHVASTAAGNFGVDPVIFGNALGVDLISGIAPRAYIAHYKALWTGRFGGSGPLESGIGAISDIVAAIDQAVADGVDVLNLSLSGSVADDIDPTELALLGASDAGVFVAAAASNEGPDAATVQAPATAPWVTAVAASTLARTFHATATLTDAGGSPPPVLGVTGESMTAALGDLPLVDAASAAAPAFTSAAAEACVAASLDRRIVSGKIVLCKRGVNLLAEKSKAVYDAGGKGMLLYNQSSDRDLQVGLFERHWVPTIHLSSTDGARVKAFIAAADRPVARLGAGTAVPGPSDLVADFSSRGPHPVFPDLAKPDVAAPGVSVLAAFSEIQAEGFYPPGDIFHIWAGTSMATPHAAGAGALLQDLHPEWSPGAIKSALMTTANSSLANMTTRTPSSPMDAGSGRIDPNRAADPGLIVQPARVDYSRYLEWIDPELAEGDLEPLEPSNLNLPSVAYGAMAGRASTRRSFTSVDSRRTSWRVAVQGLEGIDVDISPGVFAINPGETRTLDITFANVSAPFDQYSFGAVVLSDTRSGRTVQMPVSITPVKLEVPPEIHLVTSAASGSEQVELTAGYDGELRGLGWGLASPERLANQSVTTTTGAPSLDPADPGSKHYPIDVPAGAQVLAGQITNFDGGDPTTDLDLYLFYDDEGDGFQEDEEIAHAFSFTDPTEEIRVPLPAAGKYLFIAVGFTTREPSTYDFTSWLANDASPDDASNAPAITVTGDPLTVSRGGISTLTLNWSDVAADGTYFGLVTYHDSPTPALEDRIGHSLVRLVLG